MSQFYLCILFYLFIYFEDNIRLRVQNKMPRTKVYRLQFELIPLYLNERHSTRPV